MKQTYLCWENDGWGRRVRLGNCRANLRHTSELEAGEIYIFLCKVEAWAMSIGCHLTIPQYCKYQRLRDKHEVKT